MKRRELKCFAIWAAGASWLLAVGAATTLLTGSTGAGIVIGAISLAIITVANIDEIAEWATR